MDEGAWVFVICVVVVALAIGLWLWFLSEFMDSMGMEVHPQPICAGWQIEKAIDGAHCKYCGADLALWPVAASAVATGD